MTKEQINDIKIVRVTPELINSYKYCEKNYIVYFDILYLSHHCAYGKISVYNPISKMEYGKLLFNININQTNHYITDESVIYNDMVKRYKVNRYIIKQAVVNIFKKLPHETEFTLFENYNDIFI